MKLMGVEKVAPQTNIYDALECNVFLFFLFQEAENNCLDDQVYFTVEWLTIRRTKSVLPHS